jgi:hypothetical protein
MSRMTSKKRSQSDAQGEVLFIELAFHHPQCGWFYRRNVTGIRKKNCGFNFRRAKRSFRNIASVSLYRPGRPAIALAMSL